MKKILWFCMLLFVSTLAAQETELHGHVYSVQNNKPMANVHILNLNKVRGTTTNEKGERVSFISWFTEWLDEAVQM